MTRFEDRYRFVGAVYILLRDGNKVLLIRRANTGYRDGEYSLPSGHMDGGETAAQAAIRETHEEVGVIISPEDLHILHTMHRYSADPQPHERIDLYFETTSWQGKPINAEPEKCDGITWVTTDELPKNVVPEVIHMLREMTAGNLYSDFNF